ncbi:MAG: rRNA maturation RNase YbeY, partial [Chloroflexi bacterium]|nr:rRNA maturation RNase YbeY [Chloroflexota bacterium]
MTGHAEQAYSIEVQIDEPYREALSEAWLRGLVEAVLQAEGRLYGQLTLVITGDKEIRALNRDFLGNDAPTDVLSFPTAEGTSEPFIVPEEEAANYLGDVIISYPTAVL